MIIPGNGNFIMEEGHQTCFNIYTFLDPFSMANKLTDCLTGLRHIEKYQSPQLFTAQENEVLQDQALLWSFHDSIQEECHKKTSTRRTYYSHGSRLFTYCGTQYNHSR